MISIAKVVFAWACTVVIGSFTIPFPINFLGPLMGAGDPGGIAYVMELVPIFLIFSGLFSLPTLACLIIASVLLNRKNKESKLALRAVNTLHLICAILTILVGSILVLISNEGLEGVFAYSMVVLWYALVALPCWFIFFRNEIKEK